MASGRDEDSALAERAALVALLRGRPGRWGWAEITAEVLAAGSAVAVWERLVPPVLMSQAGEPGVLEVAARQVAGWTGQGWQVLTILDRSEERRVGKECLE